MLKYEQKEVNRGILEQSSGLLVWGAQSRKGVVG